MHLRLKRQAKRKLLQLATAFQYSKKTRSHCQRLTDSLIVLRHPFPLLDSLKDVLGHDEVAEVRRDGRHEDVEPRRAGGEDDNEEINSSAGQQRLREELSTTRKGTSENT